MQVYDDKNPFLGGSVDTQGHTIFSQAGVDIPIIPGSGGAVIAGPFRFPTADGSSGQVLKTDGSGTLSLGNATRSIFYGYSTSTATVSGTTDVPINTEIKKDSGFTHASASAEVTISTAGWYRVGFAVGAENTTANALSLLGKAQSNTGGGHADITGTAAYAFAPDATTKFVTASCEFYKQFAAGEILKIVTTIPAGSGGAKFISGASRLLVETI